MSDTHEPFQTWSPVTPAVAELRHGFLHPVNTFITALRVRDSHRHRRVTAFHICGMRSGKSAWIGMLLCLAALHFLWFVSMAEPAGPTKQGAISQTEAAKAEAFRLNQRAGQLAREGRVAEAIPLARRSLELSEQVHGKVHRNVSADLISLANLYLAQNDYFNAEPLIARAIDIDKQLFGPRHPEVAMDIATLANLSRMKGDKQAAVRGYREVLNMMYASPDAGSYLEETAQIHLLLGNTLLELDQYNEAMAQHLSAVEIFEVADPAFAVRILTEMADADRARGNQPRAKIWLDRAAQIEGR